MSRTRWRTGLVALLVNAAALVASAPVQACPPAERGWVTLSLNGHSPSTGETDEAELYRRVSQLLQAELERRRIVVCPNDTQAERLPSARIHLLLLPPGAPEPTSVEVQIDDGLTSKHVSRRIELSRVPADSRPLVVAVGADELLSASWAELNIKHVAAPRPPRPALRVVAPPPARRRIDIALLGTAEANGAARWRLGGALANSWWPTSAFALSLRLGFARGVAVSAPDGAVHSDSFTLVGGLLLPLVQRSYGGVEAGPALLLARTLVRGEPNAGSTGYHGAFSSVGAEAELRAWWAPWSGLHLPRWTLTSYLGVGGWFRSVDVLDGQHHIKLQRSPLASAGLGVAVQIP